ncbi:sugar kinase [Novosphingobium taihuense]|uniref:2-dehydro-3-deoxygluconokinase n=1 Tax=Novosphingobium taihuense TaxID=260085 RepID=A0A7W7AES5_9SPHN|nr:sugar kinase [Novosphingobium taihuense]MBB4614772.1 2-dehydro-3-deoxygluconokinase [Novosphingobium taihuense]TWH78876.1 2-dehydro-3-deoxygluconokinase [Novosphingobium taihuense]
MSGHVVCFGEMLLRLSPPGARMMVQAQSLDMVVGGAEANVAAALASLGHEARIVTFLPDNPLGDKVQAELGAAGVDTRFVARGSGRMGLYFMEPGAGSRPSSITYDRAGSAFALADADAFDLAGALGGARLLHMSGITPALGPKGVSLARAAIAAAQGAAVPICLDGNYRAQLWESWDSNPREVLTELVGAATALIGNHRDISLLLGKTFCGDGAERRREAVEAAFAAFPKLELVASTARHVVSSDHHRLAARVDTRRTEHQTAEIQVSGIVDRIGTGDAFAAGVLHAYLQGADAQAMAECGLALAALKHSLPGDFCLIRPGELAAFSAQGGDVRR